MAVLLLAYAKSWSFYSFIFFSIRSMDLFEKLETIWSIFVNDDILLEVDAKSQEQIQKLKPDFREYQKTGSRHLQECRCLMKVNQISLVQCCAIRSGVWHVSSFYFRRLNF